MEFRKCVEKLVPVLEESFSTSRMGIKRNYYLKNIGDTFTGEDGPTYVKECVNYMDGKWGLPSNTLLLVTDNENVAIKAAAYLNTHKSEYFDEDDGCLYDFDFDEDEGDMVRVIKFTSGAVDDKIMVNKHLYAISDVEAEEMVVFTGLNDTGDIEEKIEVIKACASEVKCIHIRPELMKQSAIQKLWMDCRGDVLWLTAPDSEYYTKLTQKMLDMANIKLSTNIGANKLVQMISKSKGDSIKEEDIAWYLDQGLKRSKERGDGKTIKTEDMRDILGNIKNPVKELEKLKGLNNLKKTALELAAMAKEELRNKKLGVIHKNMVFVGNPGTGKTTGAKLLAEIMAWNGKTNATFVVADRKKIVGRYVGHTAPLVASLFEEAKGGVLFVDEAGFFLNTNSGGYVEEAIKEFVRYMELNPDVTVIFAMYSDEVKEFLELDSGLTSRISRFVKFDDYSVGELTDITVGFLTDKGYEADEEVKSVISNSIEKMSKTKKNFGNARGARNYAQTIIAMSSIRRYKEKKFDPRILAEDAVKACDRMRTENVKDAKAFGFVHEDSVVTNKGTRKLEYAH